MPKISVIVPVYNTEKYLKRCLDSIVNQTFKDIEILIVNDGSTDESEKIILEYKNRLPQKIKYLKKENGGLSSARNLGIQKATGDYISFVDSDDYLDIKLYENLRKEIEQNTDLIKFKLIKVNNENQEINKVNGPVFGQTTGENAFNNLVFNDILLEPACIYLYKKKLFDKYKFAEKKYHEDFGLIPLIIVNAKTVSSVNVYGYYYFQSDISITRNQDYSKEYKKAIDLMFHYDNMKKQMNKCHIKKTTQENMYLYYTNALLERIKKLNCKDRKKYKTEVKERNLLKNIKITNLKKLTKKIYYYFYINM